jgi:hypothetical protein
MRGVKSSDVMHALSTLANSEIDQNRALLRQFQRREHASIDRFFSPSPASPKAKLGAERELLLYLKVRPRRLKPIPLSMRVSPVLSPTRELDGKLLLKSIQKKPRQFQGKTEIYSEWELHSATLMKRNRPNFRFNAIRDMKTLRAYHNPFSLSGALSP